MKTETKLAQRVEREKRENYTKSEPVMLLYKHNASEHLCSEQVNIANINIRSFSSAHLIGESTIGVKNW